MKVLFFGDIVGKIGRQGLAKALPLLREKYHPDIVIANVENIAHGKGVTAKTLKELKSLGIDCFTSGNHVWKKEEVALAIVESDSLLVTPANDPRTLKNGGWVILTVGQEQLLVVNLLGRVFMAEEGLTCPFREIDKILAEHPLAQAIVDFHAEATSEKMALGWYLDGRAAAVLGTHTHIPTSDSKILPQGTAYVTDVGMVGPVDSVLGVKKELIIEKFLNNSPIVFDIPESGEVEVNACYLEISAKGGSQPAGVAGASGGNQTKLASKFEKINQKVII